MLNISPRRRDGQTVTAAWEVETRMTWNAYADEVAHRFDDYRVSERSESRLALKKALPGDALTLVLTRVGSGDGPCKVSAEFVAAPF